MTALRVGKEYEWHGPVEVVPMGRLIEIQGPLLVWDNGTRTHKDPRLVEIKRPLFWGRK